MRIGVDLDDVLADLIAELICVNRQKTGEMVNRNDAVNWQVFPPEVHDAVRFEGGYTRLQPLPGARKFLTWLKRCHSVFIVTYRNEQARKDTLAWLARYLPGLYDEIRFTGGPKLEACQELQLDLFVDDSARHLTNVTGALQIPGILIDSPMNQDLKCAGLIRRAHDLDAARKWIEALPWD